MQRLTQDETTNYESIIRPTMDSDLVAVVLNNRKYAMIVPMHVANMKIYSPEGDKLTRVILPDIAVFLSQNLIRGNKVSKQGIGYAVAYNGASFPLAHIYSNSGWLCLGSLFVPAMVSLYTPLAPLETLLVFNDRCMSHGNPRLAVSKKQREQLESFLLGWFPSFNDSGIDLTKENYVVEDTIWRISAFVLEHSDDISTAYARMDDVYRLLFPKTQTKTKP